MKKLMAEREVVVEVAPAEVTWRPGRAEAGVVIVIAVAVAIAEEAVAAAPAEEGPDSPGMRVERGWDKPAAPWRVPCNWRTWLI